MNKQASVAGKTRAGPGGCDYLAAHPQCHQASRDSAKGHKGVVAGPPALVAESLTRRDLDWLVLSPSLPIA